MGLVLLLACGDNSTAGATSDAALLAKQYCATCHHFPEPDLLDRATWQNYVLPRMGHFMGIYENAEQRVALLEKGSAFGKLTAANVFPEAPILSPTEWEAIQAFYLQQAPLELEVAALDIPDCDLFQLRFPNLFLSPPSTTLIAIEDQQLFLGDANKQALLQLDADLELRRQAKIGEGIVHFKKMEKDYWLTVMGSFSPTDNALGFIYQLRTDPALPSRKVIEGLQRPVHASYADFNGDALTDVLVCEYGKWTGALSLWLQASDGTFQRHNILNRSGAIATHLLDINEDGLLDFVALFGQGRESISLFINRGNLDFQMQEIVPLPPSYGSSSLSLLDYNGDKKLDVLYTAGDNADYPSPPKPYHGLYVFIQKEDFQFQQEVFLPLPGAYRAIAADFDQDQDLDFAAVSFFPNYDSKPLEVVFFENQAGHFVAQSIPVRQMGRWIVMDSGDLDQDGDEDLVVGALTMEVPQKPDLVKQWIKQGIPFVLLENQTQ